MSAFVAAFTIRPPLDGVYIKVPCEYFHITFLDLYFRVKLSETSQNVKKFRTICFVHTVCRSVGQMIAPGSLRYYVVAIGTKHNGLLLIAEC